LGAFPVVYAKTIAPIKMPFGGNDSHELNKAYIRWELRSDKSIRSHEGVTRR